MFPASLSEDLSLLKYIFSKHCLEAAASNPSKVNDILAAVENRKTAKEDMEDMCLWERSL